MSDSHAVITQTGWFSRIGGAIKGVLIGLVLIVVSLPVLFLNEGRAVKTKKSLDQGAKEVREVSVEAPDAANEGKLIYFKGDAVAEGELEDVDFGVKAKALVLKREVQYYQWVEDTKTETKKKLGGGEEQVKTYSYDKKWVDRAVDSSQFHDSPPHTNPPVVVEKSQLRSNPIKVGGFTLSDGLVGQIDNFTELRLEGEVVFPEAISGHKVHREAGGFYVGKLPTSPEVGAARVSYKVALPGVVSVVAAQSGNGLTAFKADAGGTIEMLATGSQTAAQMFETAHQGNKMMTWILRVLGFVLMMIGFNLLFRPLSVLADVVPFIGTIVGAGTGIIAFLLSFVISITVIAVAWIFYRPLIGVSLLVLVGVGLYFLFKKMSAKKAQVA
jgi:hypothetical protein